MSQVTDKLYHRMLYGLSGIMPLACRVKRNGLLVYHACRVIKNGWIDKKHYNNTVLILFKICILCKGSINTQLRIT